MLYFESATIRQEGSDGDREASLREALSSAGTAVVFSGATVVVSLAGPFADGLLRTFRLERRP